VKEVIIHANKKENAVEISVPDDASFVSNLFNFQEKLSIAVPPVVLLFSFY